MVERLRSMRVSTLFGVAAGILFVVAGLVIVLLVNHNMREQALAEAEAKMRLTLDRNLAVHFYFSEVLKPNLFAWTEPFRPDDYFDPSWMSSTYAVRTMGDYFETFSPDDYYYKDAAIHARNPANEADPEERGFLEQLKADPTATERSSVRTIDGEPYLVVMRPGEVLEEACLRCHGDPADAPADLVAAYGAERSFHREAELGNVTSAISVRVPLAVAYGEIDRASIQLSAVLLAVLGSMFALLFWLPRRLVFDPLNALRAKALLIATQEQRLGEEAPVPFGQELGTLTQAFNSMSSSLLESRRELEARVLDRTSELERSEDLLRRERDFAQSLIETAQTIVLLLDTEGRVVHMNPFAEEISGYTQEEAEGREWFALLVPESARESARDLFPKSKLENRTTGHLYPIVTKDGRELEIEWREKALTDQRGNVLGLLATGHDMTEQRRAAEALRESEHLLAEAQAVAGLGSYALDVAAGTWTSSATLDTLFGIDAEYERSVEGWLALVHPEDHAMMSTYLRDEVLGRREAFDKEYRIVRRSDQAERWVHGLGRLEFDGEGRPVKMYGTIQDITERRAAEEALQESEQRLRQSQRLEAVGGLAGGIAHDFNNLLTAIIGQTELLRTTEHTTSEHQDGLAEIRTVADRAAALTRQLLAFSRRQALQPRVLDVNDVVESMTALVRRLLGTGIEVVFRKENALWPVEADPGQLEQVIMNLVVNAHDAMPQGGTLTIETANVHVDAATAAQRPGAHSGPHVLLEISDTGKGMDHESLAKIFEPFFTTKEPGQGTGLGLSTVYGIVKQSGGSVYVHSEPGGGATFSVYLPRAEGQLDWSPAAESPETDRTLSGNQTILLVEDEPAVRMLTARILARQGYVVLAAATPEEAIGMVDRHPGTIDVILSDVVLPGMSGPAMVDRLLAKPGFAPKVLYMSGYTRDVVVRRGQLDDEVTLLEKPFTPEDLLRKIQDVLDPPAARL